MPTNERFRPAGFGRDCPEIGRAGLGPFPLQFSRYLYSLPSSAAIRLTAYVRAAACLPDGVEAIAGFAPDMDAWCWYKPLSRLSSWHNGRTRRPQPLPNHALVPGRRSTTNQHVGCPSHPGGALFPSVTSVRSKAFSSLGQGLFDGQKKVAHNRSK